MRELTRCNDQLRIEHSDVFPEAKNEDMSDFAKKELTGIGDIGGIKESMNDLFSAFMLETEKIKNSTIKQALDALGVPFNEDTFRSMEIEYHDTGLGRIERYYLNHGKERIHLCDIEVGTKEYSFTHPHDYKMYVRVNSKYIEKNQ